MKRLLRTLLVFLFVATAYTLIMLSRPLLNGEEIEPVRVLATAVVGVLVAAGIFGVVRWQEVRERKKPRGYPTATRFRSAISKGRLPPGADSVLWQRDLTKVIRQERYFVWLGPLIFGAFAVLGIFLAAQSPGHPWFWVICAAIFTGLAIWAPISVVHRRRKMESLISELLGRHEGDQSP